MRALPGSVAPFYVSLRNNMNKAWGPQASARGLFSFSCVVVLPNQVLTHAARAAAKQPPLVAAREGLWLEQRSC